ncbi:unnamed protein product [Amoebophrya sp. A25]|nr:unnamed protein product [Amoebophrya sp. A25]|eukprot:GSA25T00014319001.1
MAVGADHCLVRTAAGWVYTWGSNKAGQLGVRVTATTQKEVREPYPLELPARCVSVAAHGDGSGLVLEDGVAGVFGQAPPIVNAKQTDLKKVKPSVAKSGGRALNNAKENPEDDVVDKPPILAPEQAWKVRYFRTAAEPSVIGVPLVPKEQSSVPEMHRIALSGNFGILLSVFGDVYSFGSATLGQLGLGFHTRQASRPTMILKGSGFRNADQVFPPVRHLDVSPTHCLAITADNELALWGQALVSDVSDRPPEAEDDAAREAINANASSASQQHDSGQSLLSVFRSSQQGQRQSKQHASLRSGGRSRAPQMPLRRGIAFPVAVCHDLWTAPRGTTAASVITGKPLEGDADTKSKDVGDNSGNIANTALRTRTTPGTSGGGTRADRSQPPHLEQQLLLGCCCGTQGGVVYTRTHVLAFRRFTIFSEEDGLDPFHARHPPPRPSPASTWLAPADLSYIAGYSQVAQVEKLFASYSSQEWLWAVCIKTAGPGKPDPAADPGAVSEHEYQDS